jgi:hypothetical protein
MDTLSGKKKKELWLRLHHYHFEHVVPPHLTDHVAALFGGSDAFTQAFASKIARKLSWSRGYTLRAIAEYKKFVFLGIVSDESVTPPKIIDKVWHEHLLFSRAYREFCREVLRRDFDHNPELVPTDKQTDTFHAQFDRTLARYRDEFGEEPPADIWGTPKFKTTRKSRESDTSGDSSHFYVDGGGGGGSGGGSDEPLHRQFDSSDGDSGLVHSDPTLIGNSHAHDAGHDSGGGFFSSFSGGDSGSDSGGDSGGGDGGGSGCSSSCGGGGCSS